MVLFRQVNLRARGLLIKTLRISLVAESLKQFILICILEDAYFYYVHRLTHEVKWFYKWVHYLHHEWTAPVAISVSYMHPIEWILVNMTLVYVGPVIIGAHAAVVFSYYCFIFTKGIWVQIISRALMVMGKHAVSGCKPCCKYEKLTPLRYR